MLALKKFTEITVAIKSVGTMIFAGMIIVYTVFGGFFFGLNALSFSLVWQAMLIAFMASSLHFVVFSDSCIQEMKYTYRMLLFAVPLLLIISAFAYGFRWFPVDSGLYWLIFLGIYLFLFGIVTLVFHLYFVVTGKKYTALLDVYNKQHRVEANT